MFILRIHKSAKERTNSVKLCSDLDMQAIAHMYTSHTHTSIHLPSYLTELLISEAFLVGALRNSGRPVLSQKRLKDVRSQAYLMHQSGPDHQVLPASLSPDLLLSQPSGLTYSVPYPEPSSLGGWALPYIIQAF